MTSIEPLKHTGVTLKLKQSSSAVLPKLSTRMIVSGPSGVGKGVLTCQLLLNPKFYRGCFERIFYFSQSAKVDSNLKPLQQYCKEELEQKEPCLYDSFDEEFLREHLEEQLQMTQHMKKRAEKQGKRTAAGFQTCIVIDDFADMPSVMRKAGGILATLFIRGRHANISVFVLTQKYKAISPEIRLNMNALCFFRQRSKFDLDAFLEENSAIVDRKTLEAMYRKATSQDHGFLYLNLMERDANKMFFKGFTSRLVISSKYDESDEDDYEESPAS